MGRAGAVLTWDVSVQPHPGLASFPNRLPLGDCTSPFALSPAFLLAQLGEMGRHPN